jgi:hypothetical protein
MLILSGHSAGIENGFLMKDEDPAESMEIGGLKKVLIAVKRKLHITLDILGMDSCLMSMAEICFEFRGLAKFLVSSQSMTPNPGWPYGEIIKHIIASAGKIQARQLASLIVGLYVNSYVEEAVNTALSTDASALDIAKSLPLAQKVRQLAGGIREGLRDKDNSFRTSFLNALILSHWQAQSYNGELFVDLFDFCELYQTRLESVSENYKDRSEFIEDLIGKCEDVKNAVHQMVVASCFCGPDYQYSFGVSIYFPWSTIFAFYGLLAFAKKSGANWNNFIEDYVTKTRRTPKGEEEKPRQRRRFLMVPFETERDRRRVEPFSHGPFETVRSMRNPPLIWSKNAISPCIKNKHKLEELFEYQLKFLVNQAQVSDISDL